jgi:hypothetical protein
MPRDAAFSRWVRETSRRRLMHNRRVSIPAPIRLETRFGLPALVQDHAGLALCHELHLNFLYDELDTVCGKHPWNRGER